MIFRFKNCLTVWMLYYGVFTWALMGSHDVRGWTSPYTTSSCSFANVPIKRRKSFWIRLSNIADPIQIQCQMRLIQVTMHLNTTSIITSTICFWSISWHNLCPSKYIFYLSKKGTDKETFWPIYQLISWPANKRITNDSITVSAAIEPHNLNDVWFYRRGVFKSFYDISEQ